MDTWLAQYPAIAVPIHLIAGWLAITTLLALLSHWFRLMGRFPNRPEVPLLRVGGQTGLTGPFGLVGLHGMLRFEVCPSGLRVGMMRVFGPFCRDYLVPWADIRVTRKAILFWPTAKLQFGTPPIGSLTIEARLANRLARAAAGRWPEAGPFPQESRRDILHRVLIEWALMTSVAALFFTLGPRIAGMPGEGPPVAMTVLFPAVACGIFAIVRYVRLRS